MSLKVVTAHIPVGESLSNGVDCTEGTIIRIAAPTDGWDGANISFEVNTEDGPKYHVLVNSAGDLIQCPVAIGCTMSVRELSGLDPGWYKIRSGSDDNPIVQKGNRDFSFVLLVDAAAASASQGTHQQQTPQRQSMPTQKR